MCEPGAIINCLSPDALLKGVIVKEKDGHRFSLLGDKKYFLQSTKRSKRLGIKPPCEFTEEFTGKREELRTRIKALNHMAKLPGVGFEEVAA